MKIPFSKIELLAKAVPIRIEEKKQQHHNQNQRPKIEKFSLTITIEHF